MKVVIILALIAVACAAYPPGHKKPDRVPGPTGTTPPPVACPDSLCAGRSDGNYEYNHHGKTKPHYFVQCVYGKATCQACWPLSLYFSQNCNQCLYKKHDACATTKSYEAAPTYPCPDLCPSKGAYFSGNIADSNNKRQYVACWKGITVGCVPCPESLEFSEGDNACLYGGKFFTQRSH